jgi:cell division septal protein FtsQ
MRQSLAQLEQEFHDQIEQDRRRSEQLRREAARRSRQRRLQRRRKRGSIRFWVLVSTLVLIAAGVAVAMFETLYLLLG